MGLLVLCIFITVRLCFGIVRNSYGHTMIQITVVVDMLLW